MAIFLKLKAHCSKKLKILRYIVCALPLIFAWQSAPAQDDSKAHIPDWFYKVSPAGEIGSIGYAYRYSATYGENTAFIAMINAVDSLKPYIGESEFVAHKKDIFQLIMGKKNEVTFSKGILRTGSSFEDGGMRFHHMVFKQNNAPEVNEEDLYSPTCDFKNCQPGWLCSQVKNNKAGFLGISYRASSPGRQLEIAQKNALEILQYSLGVDIKGQEEFYKVNSSVIKINYRFKDYDVTKSSRTSEAYLYTKAQCFRGNTLFSWQVSEELPAYPAAKNLDWMNNPSTEKITGAVGYSRKDYTGFFSRQLRHAYENGIAELAKIYGTKVTSSETHSNSSESGRKSISDIVIEYEQKLKPKILGVYVDDEEQMFVWVASDVSP